jgi:hypothetical protein
VNEFGKTVERHRRELLDSVKESVPLRPSLYRVATNERLPRKYVCGVVPSIVRNISMKALTLS